MFAVLGIIMFGLRTSKWPYWGSYSPCTARLTACLLPRWWGPAEEPIAALSLPAHNKQPESDDAEEDTPKSNNSHVIK